jgi:hypothetical protein
MGMVEVVDVGRYKGTVISGEGYGNIRRIGEAEE